MGSFQADVSTVNNQPNNYDTTNFDDRQYEYDPNLGGWNPFGSGHFRIVDASVVRVCKKDGKCNENDEMVGAKFVGEVLRNHTSLPHCGSQPDFRRMRLNVRVYSHKYFLLINCNY